MASTKHKASGPASTEITYTIDRDKVTFGVVEELERAGSNLAAQMKVLRRIVVVENGDFGDIPMRHFKPIIMAIFSDNDVGN